MHFGTVTVGIGCNGREGKKQRRGKFLNRAFFRIDLASVFPIRNRTGMRRPGAAVATR
jgi:hypothetical protein